MRLFKFIFIILYLNLSFYFIFSNNINKIKIGFYDNPPKIYKDKDGNFTGYHIDIIKEIAKNENWDIEFIEGTWQESLKRLKNGDIDIMPDVAYSEEREKIFDFNKESILLNWAVVYVRKDSTDIINILDLNNKKIASMKNSIHTEGDKGIINILQSFNLKGEFILTKDYNECFELLSKGKVEACVVNKLFGLANERVYNVKRTSIIFNPSQIKYAFSKNSKRSEYLINRIDENILKFKEDKNSILYKSFNKYILKNLKIEKRLDFNIKTILLILLGFIFLFSSFLFIFISNKNKNVNYSNYLKSNPSMNIIRNNIIDIILIVFTIFSFPLTLFFIYQGLNIKWDNILFVNVLMTIILLIIIFFLKKINLISKLIVLITIFFLNGVIILILWGRIGIGGIFFLVPAIIIGIMHGKKGGFIVLFIGFLITIFLGLLISFNILEFRYDITQYSSNISNWLFSLLIILVVFITIISGIEKFYSILIDSVENLELTVKQRTLDLQNANDILKKEIEERIKTEKELIIAKVKAEEANKTKSNFLANITHEIRTPLNAILGYSQILRLQEDIKDQYKRQLETIITSGEHLLDLINEVLEMSKIESGILSLNMDNFDLYNMMDEIHRLFKIKMDKKGLDFSIKIDNNVPKLIFSDRIKIKQVIINLVGNAFKFTKKGYVKVEVFNNKDKIGIKVIDSGIGISEDELQKIFIPFEQTSSGKFEGGTGLGLFISKKFANLLDGDIIVKSKIGEGSIFTFEFSYKLGCESLLKEETTIKNVIKIKGDKKVKALIVDDRDNNRDILIKILSPLGFDTIEAKDGLTALNIIKEYNPDLILLDIVMPDISGIEVIKRLRESGNNVKIIAITASVMDENKDRVLQEGANSFIIKPFKKNIILEEIKRVLDIEYIYEEEEEQKNKEEKLDLNSIKKMIYDLPEDIRQKFKQSLIIGDIKEIKKINDIFKEHNYKLFLYLKDMIDNFDFDVILSLLN